MVRVEAEPQHGIDPYERPMETYLKYGVVNLDKPSGPTSHQVTAWVKEILHLKKAGHGGTLDPKVTGVLPVFLEKATKVVRVTLYSSKAYVVLMHLHKKVDPEQVKKALQAYVGVITQVPPVRSKVARRPRKRRIYNIEVLEIEGKDVLFKIESEAGFYVRKFCHDFGQLTGFGAHMVELRRIKAGCFTEESSVTLQDLEDAYYFWKEEGNGKFLRHVVRPVEEALEDIPKVYVLDSAVDAICHGAPLTVRGISKIDERIARGDLVAMMSLRGELIGIGFAALSAQEMLAAERGIAVKTDAVLMEPNTYPRLWK